MSGSANNPPILLLASGIALAANPTVIEFWRASRPVHLKKVPAERPKLP